MTALIRTKKICELAQTRFKKAIELIRKLLPEISDKYTRPTTSSPENPPPAKNIKNIQKLDLKCLKFTK